MQGNIFLTTTFYIFAFISYIKSSHVKRERCNRASIPIRRSDIMLSDLALWSNHHRKGLKKNSFFSSEIKNLVICIRNENFHYNANHFRSYLAGTIINNSPFQCCWHIFHFHIFLITKFLFLGRHFAAKRLNHFVSLKIDI